MSDLDQLKADLKKLSRPGKKEVLKRFFKTGPGQYGEGDVFIGVTVPDARKVAGTYRNISLSDLNKLLGSEIHEERLTALLILVHKFKVGGEKEKKSVTELFLRNTKNVNSWDLVDSSSHQILGQFLRNRERKILYRLAKSKNLWKRRISIVSTYAFIKNNEFDDTLKISEILMDDSHDLIHKAVGWMLREVGKRDFQKEESFIKKFHKRMPRTMLRYAIERFPERKRLQYMKK